MGAGDAIRRHATQHLVPDAAVAEIAPRSSIVDDEGSSESESASEYIPFGFVAAHHQVSESAKHASEPRNEAATSATAPWPTLPNEAAPVEAATGPRTAGESSAAQPLNY
eukprot:4408073-Prymnesium_polylepis.1